MDERTRRIGLNEAVFRQVNERLEAVQEGFGELSGRMAAVCECGDASCAQQFSLPTGRYAEVRRDPTLFLVVPGHEIEDTEDVVERGDGFAVVRKRTGDPAELAAALAPPRD